jgi:hypothetical protein
MECDVNMHWRIYLLNDKNVMEKKMLKLPRVDIFSWSSKNWFSFVTYVSTNWFALLKELKEGGLLSYLYPQTSRSQSWFFDGQYV